MVRQALARASVETGRRNRPRPVNGLLVGSGLVAFVAALSVVATGPLSVALDDAQQLVAIGAVLASCLLVARETKSPAIRRFTLETAWAIAAVAAGTIIWDLGDASSASAPSAPFFIVGMVIAIDALRPRIFDGLDRTETTLVVIDCALVFVAGVMLLAGYWQRFLGSTLSRSDDLLAICGAVAVAALASAAAFSLIARGIAPSRHGPWPALGGVFLASLSWMGWLASLRDGVGLAVSPFDYLFSAGFLAVGYGVATWEQGTQCGADVLVLRRLRDSLPAIAVLLCLCLPLFGSPSASSFSLCSAALVADVAFVRLLYVLHVRRLSRRDELQALRALQVELADRARGGTPVECTGHPASLVDAGRLVCDAALRLDWVDAAWVATFGMSGSAAVTGTAGFEEGLSGHIRAIFGPHSADRARRHAETGAWAERTYHATDPWLVALRAEGVEGSVNAPLLWNDRLIGAVGLGVRRDVPLAELTGHMAAAREFAAVAAPLIGPALAEQDELEAARACIAAVIEESAFRIVFQPIFELSTGATIGYEALARFSDGASPAERFETAVSVGMSLGLEKATLEAVIGAASALPNGPWLSVNLSPELAADLGPLVPTLESTGHSIVLEITEHTLVEDYGPLRAALADYRDRVRISIDDAGAGYAGLRHIVELNPDFVKLDIGLVRQVDADPARRAMIGAMVTFARQMGSTIIAEGIEREAERATLCELGVDLGQGFLLGRPATAGSLSGDRYRAEDAA